MAEQYFLKGFVGAMPEAGEARGFRFCKFIIGANCGNVDRPKKIWVKCTAWRELAELVAKNVFAGDLVAINGRIDDVEAWIDPRTKKAKGALAVQVSAVFKSKAPGQFTEIRA